MGVEGGGVAMPADALRLAIDALQSGRHDPRDLLAAQANALESIAWSLIGLLAQRASLAEGSSAEQTLSQDLRKRGFVPLGAAP